VFDDAQKIALTEKVVGLTRKRKPEDYQEILAPFLNHRETGLDAASVVWGVFQRPELVRKPVEAALKPYEKGGRPEEACDLIADMGERGSEYIPALEALISSTKDYDTLWAAACALEAMRANAAPALATLLRLLGHESGRIGGAAASALGHIGPPAIPGLIKIVKKGPVRAKEYAADALGRLGPAAEGALPALVEMRVNPDRDGELQKWQALAIAEISLKKSLAPMLLVMTGDENLDLQRRATAALERMEVSRREAVEAARRELADIGDSDPVTAAALREALKRFRR